MENIEEKTLYATIFIGIVQIIIGYLGLKQQNSFILAITIFVMLTSTTIIAILGMRFMILKEKYLLMIYLFHNNGINQFNIVPKLLLLMDREKKYNNVVIDQIEVCYKLYFQKEKYNADIRWRMKGIQNNSKKDISEYYFYTGTEYGDCLYHNIMLYSDYKECKYEIVDIKESNRIKLLTWSFPVELKPQDNIKDMSLVLSVEDIFHFDVNQVLYFIPRNFAKDINMFEIKVEVNFKHIDFDMELREIGKLKGSKQVTEHILKCHKKVNSEKKSIYYFVVEKKRIKMNNIYYILIKPRNCNKNRGW